MTKPLASLRDRPLAQHALVMAYKRALERQTSPGSSTYRRHNRINDMQPGPTENACNSTGCVDPQLRLELEAK